jgi:hypothetical protein
VQGTGCRGRQTRRRERVAIARDWGRPVMPGTVSSLGWAPRRSAEGREDSSPQGPTPSQGEPSLLGEVRRARRNVAGAGELPEVRDNRVKSSSWAPPVSITAIIPAPSRFIAISGRPNVPKDSIPVLGGVHQVAHSADQRSLPSRSITHECYRCPAPADVKCLTPASKAARGQRETARFQASTSSPDAASHR